jgi:WD40 repeat protein
MRGRWAEPAPGEHEAGERAWPVVLAAFESRERLALRRRRRELRPALVLAAAAAAVGVALGTAGATVVRSIRGEAHARTALAALPGGGRLLVDAGDASWIVAADGSKRRLDGLTDATWSPHGLYVVGVRRGHELAAVSPDGGVRWTLARRGSVRLPSWNRPDGFRIAYLAGDALRVVAGNGHDDRLVARPAARVRPAWKPGPDHVLAYAGRGGTVAVVDGDRGAQLWVRRFPSQPRQLAWSDDGTRLLVVLDNGARVLDAAGNVVLAERARVVAAAFAPGGHAVAEIRAAGGRSVVALAGRGQTLFRGAGTLSGLAWSPDGRWLVVAWPSADQLLFIRSAAVEKVVAFSAVAATFDAFPQLAGWAAAPG